MGRTARGVIGMKPAKGKKLISLLVAEDENDFVLTATRMASANAPHRIPATPVRRRA